MPNNPTRIAWAHPRRVHFLGCPLDVVSMTEALACIETSIKSGRRLQHVAVNVAKLVNMKNNDELRRDVEESDMITVDGSGVAIGCRIMGMGHVERVTGIDLMENILSLCASKGYRPYILGAKQDILDRAIANIKERHPKISFAGSRNGYFKQQQEDGIVAEIAASGADCLFIAMPSPHKERLMQRYKDQFNVPFLMGVGGSVDVLAGFVNRAPQWMQKLGLEWFYRMIQEPRRLFYRYFTTNSRYAGLLMAGLMKKTFAG